MKAKVSKLGESSKSKHIQKIKKDINEFKKRQSA